MRLFRLALLTAVVTATAGVAAAQFPGGDRGGGDRGRGGPPSGFSGGRSSFSMDPDERFNQMSGGKDSFNVNGLPPDQKDRFMRFAPMMGLQIPPDGTVTRATYKAASEQMRARMQQGGGMMFGRGGPPGSMSMTTAPGSVPVAPGAPSMTPSPSGGSPGFGGPPGGFGGDRGRGGFDPSSMPDDQIRQMMSRYDNNPPDGRLSQEEAQRSDRLRDGFATYDVNRDGFIDLSEYRGYLISRMSPSSSSPGQTPGSPSPWGGQPQWGPPGGYPGAPGTYPGQTPPPVEDPRPVVFRYGKLPKEFPYADLDEDKDGQIGLYEWKAASKAMAEFKELDLNRDGYLTAEEFLRARPPAAPKDGDRSGSLADERPNGDRSERGRDDRSREDRSPSKDRGPSRDRGGKDEMKEEKRQPGGNPFSRNR